MRRLLLTAAGLLAVVLLVAAGASRVTPAGASRPCDERVWSAALGGLTDDGDPCAVAAQERLYAVAAGLMGLVLISTLLVRPRS